MNSLVSIARTEWLKLGKYRPFWILFWLYPVSLGGIVGVALWTQSHTLDLAKAAGAEAELLEKAPMAFPQVWQNLSYAASWLYFIPVLLIILNVSNEFSFRSYRQNLLEGWSRAQFLGAKFLWALALSFFCTANTLLFTLGAGLYTGTGPTAENLSFLGLFFLQTLFYCLFALLFVFIIRRAALSLGAFFMYSIVVENLASFLINRNTQGLGAYLPLNVANALLPLPYYEDHAPEMAKAFFTSPPQSALLVATGLYLCLFLSFMYYRFKREDL